MIDGTKTPTVHSRVSMTQDGDGATSASERTITRVTIPRAKKKLQSSAIAVPIILLGIAALKMKSMTFTPSLAGELNSQITDSSLVDRTMRAYARLELSSQGARCVLLRRTMRRSFPLT
jgi:hypothetical protein